MHVLHIEFWSIILGIIGIIVCILVFIVHKYYKNQTKMIDGSYPEHEPDLINQIEDLFMEELYENNLKHSKQYNQINQQFMLYSNQNNKDDDHDDVKNDIVID